MNQMPAANENEAQAAARAIMEERRRAEDAKLVESLTDRERHLIEYAWELGADEQRSRLAKALENPQAVTLDAKQVAQAVATTLRAPKVAPAGPGFGVGLQGYDDRIARMIRSVDRNLEMERRYREEHGVPGRDR